MAQPLPTTQPPTSTPNATTTVDRAQTSDVPSIHTIITAAYNKYVERIGKKPAPMLTDYAQLINSAEEEVYVLRDHDNSLVLGSIVLAQTTDSLKINNLVVDAEAQGRGYGKVLMEFAYELARERGLGSITLFTNVMMWENVALYGKLGFEETGRRMEDGYERVYFRKDMK